MPNKGSTVKFENYYKQQAVPFVIYADFEAITEKVHSCKLSDEKSYTAEAYQKHNDKYSKPVQTYRGKKAVYKFMEAMLDEVL